MLATIKLNSQGNLVKIAQYLTGFSERNKASGIFNEAFDEHVFNWQAAKNVANPDGIIGPNTWTKIANTAPTCSSSKNKTSAYTCAIQLLLGGLDVDGVYGTKTKKAVSTFQSANKLTADGICGPKTWSALIIQSNESSGDEPISGNTKPVDYKQNDSRWGKIKYSTHTSAQTIGNSGCGPTAMADIVATWWDKSVTPKEMCELSVANGYRTYDNGTAWGFFQFCAEKYQAQKFITTTSLATLKSALADGAYAVVSFGKSKWTTQG